MNICFAICLLFMLLLVATTAIKIITLNRAERLRYLSNFKKGKCVIIYLAAIPLFWFGLVYGGESKLNAIFAAIELAIGLVVLKYSASDVSALMADNLFYRWVMVIAFVLVTANAVLFTITLFIRKGSIYLSKLKATKLSKKTYVIVGFNEQTKAIIKSIIKQKSNILLLDKQDDEILNYCYINKIGFVKINEGEKLDIILSELFVSFNDKLVNVIINTNNDVQNLICVEQLSKIIESLNLDELNYDGDKGLNTYVFGEPNNANSFLYFVEKTKGLVRYINKYKLIAMNFVDKYPFTRFMDENFINVETATIKETVTINNVLIGFGKTNQQLFLTSVANNQYLYEDNKSLKQKSVNYYVFDKRDSQNDKNLNHNYYRYEKEIAADKDKYLPLPTTPANVSFYELDINDADFYNCVRKSISNGKENYLLNYLVIAFSTDMENLDFAEKLTAKLKEWNLFECSKVFVKIRNSQFANNVVKDELAINSGFIVFGNESEIVYNISEIVDESAEAMARDRHLSYALTDKMSESDKISAKRKALKTWYMQAQVQRESNIYACLSIREKLNLLGYDYCKKSEAKESLNAEFFDKYTKGDPIVYDGSYAIEGRKKIVYSNNNILGSLRYNFAVLEHQRWNAYMISCGFIPSTVEQIKNGDSKNIPLRRHGNITTFEGLKEFRSLEAKRRGLSEEDTDVIRYDYQIMDDLVWLLDKNGYKIVKKASN